MFSFVLQLHGSSFEQSPVFTRMCQENEALSKGYWQYRGQTAQAVINKNCQLGRARQKKNRKLPVDKVTTPAEFVTVSSRQVRIRKLRVPTAGRS